MLFDCPIYAEQRSVREDILINLEPASVATFLKQRDQGNVAKFIASCTVLEKK
jgi:hypothetical protein